MVAKDCTTCNARRMANTIRLLGTAEVCRRLHVNKSTLTRWVASGRIAAAQKLPGKNGAYLFDPTEVQRLEDEAKATETQTPGRPAA